jgi:hypothetical protein
MFHSINFPEPWVVLTYTFKFKRNFLFYEKSACYMYEKTKSSVYC